MAKNKQTPGNALSALLKKYNLNYNRLAKAINLSSAMVRLIARDENPVSAAVAFRLAKFFKQKPEYWLSLQADYDLAKTTADKKLAKELKDIPTVDKATFDRKPKAKAATAKKTGKKARAAKVKKAAAAKTAPKKAAAKPKKAAAKKAVKKAAPKKAVKAKAAPLLKTTPPAQPAPASPPVPPPASSAPPSNE